MNDRSAHPLSEWDIRYIERSGLKLTMAVNMVSHDDSIVSEAVNPCFQVSHCSKQWSSHLVCMQLPREIKTQISGPMIRFFWFSFWGEEYLISNKFLTDANTVWRTTALGNKLSMRK